MNIDNWFEWPTKSTDPGVMMPELGRRLVDEEGVALIRDWIVSLQAQTSRAE